MIEVGVRGSVKVEATLYFKSAVVLAWVVVVCCVGFDFYAEKSLCGCVVEELTELLLTFGGYFCGSEGICSVAEEGLCHG
jgi:propanediol dehydratase large subunit